MTKPDRPRKTGPSEAEIGEFYESLQDLVHAYQFRDRNRSCYKGISANQCYVLEWLEREGELTVRALANHLQLNKSNASRITAELAERGFVRTTADPSDGRSVLVRLTVAGARLHARIRADLEKEQQLLLARFPREVRAGVSQLLRDLAQSARRR